MTPQQAVDYGVMKTQVETVKELMKVAQAQGQIAISVHSLQTGLDAAERGFKDRVLKLAREMLG